MRTLYLLLSNLATLFFGYMFVANLRNSFEFSYLIFMTLLAIVFFIFIILSVLSFPKRTRSRSLFYNSYSERRTKNAEFDKFYSFMNE